MSLLQEAALLFRQGKLDQALQRLSQAAPGAGRYRAEVMLLIRRRADGDLATALGIIRRWKQADGKSPEPFQREVEIHLNQQQIALALQSAEDFCRAFPALPPAKLALALTLQLNDNHEQAFAAYCKLVSTAQSSAAAQSGSEAEARIQLDAVLRMVEAELGNYPGAPGRDDLALLDTPWLRLKVEACLLAWETASGWPERRSSDEIRREVSNAWYNLGCSDMADFDRLEECLACFDKAIELNPDHVLARTNRLFALNYSTHLTALQIAEQHLVTGQWLTRQAGQNQSRAGRLQPRHARPLRIAYLSSDFRQHSVAWFILPVLAAHDSSQFEIHAFHTDERQDAVSQQVRGLVKAYHAVAGLSDAELAKKIESTGIDVLIELNGMTQGHRLQMLAQRVAPVQISWLGYPNTTGLDSMDFRLVDAITDRPGESDHLASEQLVRLPQTFSVYQPPRDLPSLRSSSDRSDVVFTFGSFNNLAKLNHSLIETWADILHRVPDTQLLIKNPVLSHREPARRLLQAFTDLGVDDSRIRMLGRSSSHQAHLACYQQVDLCLDSFPYNGTTTTCDSLMMGVPVVSCAGGDHRSRVGASQLNAVGLQQLVATNRSDYASIAVALAQPESELQALRSGLRERMLNSPLTDAEGFTRNLEAVLLELTAGKQ